MHVLSIAKGYIGAWNRESSSCRFFKAAVRATAVASTLFAHPVGMVLTAGVDLYDEMRRLETYLQQGQYDKVLESCIKEVNSALYLACLATCGVQFKMAALALQIAFGLYQMSNAHHHCDSNLEMAAHTAMIAILGRELSCCLSRK